MGYINPLVELPAGRKILAIKGDMIPRALLVELLREARDEADAKAWESWRKRKGPMAGYWRATCTYFLHAARLLKRGGSSGAPAASMECSGHEWESGHRQDDPAFLLCTRCGAMYEDVPEGER